MKKSLFILLIFLILFSTSTLALEKDCLYYFYGEGCPHCGATGIFLEKLDSKYTGLQLHKLEIYYNKTNLNLLQDYFNAYQVPLEKQRVPIIFLSESYFVGDKPIINYLENALISNKDEACPSLEKEETLGIIGKGSPKHLIETLTFGVITGAAFVDSINPAALAVLLILLGLLLAIKKRKKLLQSGIAFIAAVYLAYFLSGLGLLGTFTRGYYFYKIVGGLAIILGLAIIYYFRRGKVFLKEIQEKKKLKKIIKGIISPAVVLIIGFMVSLFSFFRLGETFSVISNLLAEKATKWAAMPLLLYYNLIFVLPLIIITLVIYFSLKKIEEHGKEKKVDIHGEIEKWRQKNIRLLHLIAGIIMLVLGVVILLVL